MPTVRYTFSAALPAIDGVLRFLEQEVDVAVRRTGFKWQQEAVKVLNQHVYNRRRSKGDYIPTGALRSGLFVQTSKGDNPASVPTFDQAAVAARARAAKRGKIIQIARRPPKPRITEAYAGACVSYAVYVNFPTRGRPGVYFMETALIKVRPYFKTELSAAVARAKKRG